jgi:hypothetical protein
VGHAHTAETHDGTSQSTGHNIARGIGRLDHLLKEQVQIDASFSSCLLCLSAGATIMSERAVDVGSTCLIETNESF